MARKGRPRIALSKLRISSPARRIWLVIGGLGGLVAIVALAVELVSLGQGWAERRSQDNAEATAIAIMDAQLAVQREIATFQASDVSTGPTATVVARRIAQLMSTRDALESERLKLEATLTPVAPGAPKDVDTGSVPMRVMSQVPGLAAELVEFSSFENTITAKVRFTNSGEQPQRLRLTTNSYLLDEATTDKFWVYDQSNSGFVDVPADDSFTVWAKYGLPEEADPRHLTLVLPNGVLFEHLRVPWDNPGGRSTLE